ncbi:MAG TPA: tetratricopeptide repeat protein, partial [Streptosporangiaceae bacterium]|nr:tetratricopeptide repeat protein [Streptosporangiaceae bacterium]
AGTAVTYHLLGVTALDQGKFDEAEECYREALILREEMGDSGGIADTSHQLGNLAMAVNRLDEADDWYRKALALEERLGRVATQAATLGQLGLLAEMRGDDAAALDWTVRCLALFSEFPHPLTGPGPRHLARLTRQLGFGALEETWQRITGDPLPQAVRDYVEAGEAE